MLLKIGTGANSKKVYCGLHIALDQHGLKFIKIEQEAGRERKNME
jgi:hypothetical protein